MRIDKDFYVCNKGGFPMKDIPYSKIKGKRKIGKKFFENEGYIENTSNHPLGMVDSMTIFDREDFNHSDIHPLISEFYTSTIHYDMEVKESWLPLIKPFAMIYKKLSASMEQMNFPVSKTTTNTNIESEIYKILDKYDGRKNVRAWVRSDKKTGKAFYAAAYSTHSDKRGERYFNVFFPLPFGGMTSILRIENYQESGVLLTSLKKMKRGDQGVYMTVGSKTFKLPINETIWVTEKAGSLIAKHDSWLFGVKVLVLDYVMKKKT